MFRRGKCKKILLPQKGDGITPASGITSSLSCRLLRDPGLLSRICRTQIQTFRPIHSEEKSLSFFLLFFFPFWDFYFSFEFIISRHLRVHQYSTLSIYVSLARQSSGSVSPPTITGRQSFFLVLIYSPRGPSPIIYRINLSIVLSNSFVLLLPHLT